MLRSECSISAFSLLSMLCVAAICFAPVCFCLAFTVLQCRSKMRCIGPQPKCFFNHSSWVPWQHNPCTHPKNQGFSIFKKPVLVWTAKKQTPTSKRLKSHKIISGPHLTETWGRLLLLFFKRLFWTEGGIYHSRITVTLQQRSQSGWGHERSLRAPGFVQLHLPQSSMQAVKRKHKHLI